MYAVHCPRIAKGKNGGLAMKNHAMTALLLASWIFMTAFLAWGEFYQYQDDKGTIHFTDDQGKIPKEYRDKQRVRDAGISEPDNSVTPVIIEDNHVLVPVTIGYRGKQMNARFILDTGADTCTVSPDLANRLNIKREDANVVLAQGIGGVVFVVGQTKVDFVSVGPNRKYDLDVSVVKSGSYDGLLGMNFLRELRYHIDFNTSTIKWGD
jgi:predicted aspartyl protease